MIFQLSKTIWAVVFSFLSMFVLGLCDNMRGPLYPEVLKFFDLTNSQGAVNFALTSTAAVIANTLSAYSLRKIYLDRLLSVSVVALILAPLIMGLAPTYAYFLVGAVVLGLGFGSLGVAQNLLIAENTTGTAQTRALAGLHSIYGFSSLIAPYLASRAPAWFAVNFPRLGFMSEWRSAFFVISALGSMLFVTILISRPRSHFEAHVDHDESKHGKKSSFTKLMWVAGFFASYVGAEILISSRLALYMRTYFNMSLQQSSNYVTYFFVFLLIGRLTFAIKTFKSHIKTQMNLSLILSIFSLALGLWIHPIFLSMIGLTMAPFYPLAIVYISDITGVQKRRFLTFAMGMQGLFVIFMHLGVGVISDVFGLFTAFGLGILLLIGSIICLNMHPKISSH